MNDLCLKFDDEASALAAMGFKSWDNRSADIRVDIIGPIYRPIGEPGPDGMQPVEQLAGWHVNMLLDGPVPERLQPYVVTPAQRVRVWA